MQVTKFFVSYVNNKILKKIIERGFCRATSFAKKYLSDTQVNERNQESYKLKIYLKCQNQVPHTTFSLLVERHTNYKALESKNNQNLN